MPSKLTAVAANEFLATAFAGRDDRGQIITVQEGRAVARLDVNESHLRPGGYISGPTQMTLADMVAYMVIMTRLGIEPMAVTSNLNIHFLRPCIGETMIADGQLMKLGRSLAIVEVNIRSEGNAQRASHAMVTYAAAGLSRQAVAPPDASRNSSTANLGNVLC